MDTKKNMLGMLFCFMLFCGCNETNTEQNVAKWKAEIVQTELDFSNMAQKDGIPKAFLAYAAKDVALLRNNKLIHGIDALRNSYTSLEADPKTSLTWSPDFVDVSTSGDLGYTYGNYVYTTVDSLGNTNSQEGVFHTVWKRQEDGSWKFVWD